MYNKKNTLYYYILNLSFFFVIGEGVCSWVNYLGFVVFYTILIYLSIKDHIDTEVAKEVYKIVKRYDSLRKLNNNDNS